MNPTTCPKCGHARQADAPTPDWQCPACGVAYAKAAEAAAAQRRPAGLAQPIYLARPPSAITPGRVLAWILMLCGAAYAWHAVQQRGGVEAVAERVAHGPAGGMQALAAKVQPGDIVIYTTATCPYCAQAKAWLSGQGFAYTECDTGRDSRCESEYGALQGRGVPLLVVRGKRLPEGFDGHAFLAALSEP